MKIDKNILISIFSGAFASLIVLAVLFLVAWNFKGDIFEYLATDYAKDFSENSTASEISALSQESFVVSAVEKATPAVVSIVATKELPTYETYFNRSPFGNFFDIPDFFFNVPQQRQNGTEEREIGGGTGFFVTEDGLIITNRHVVEDVDARYVVVTNDLERHEAKILARDTVLDIAILKVEGRSFPYLELGDSDNISVGQSVIAIGNALAEFQNSVSVGVISGLSRSLTAGDGAGRSEFLSNVIQTDAAINPGNSGGPLLDILGKVIGVNVAMARGSENIGFSLPINSVKSIVDSVKETGKIERPFVGIRYIQINELIKQRNNLAVDYGLLVLRGESQEDLAVIPGSPANKAGILENDIILEIDGKKLTKDENFAQIIRNKKVGDIVALKILSKGKEKTLNIKLELAPN